MKILSLEKSLTDSTTSHSLWYFDKYFGSPRASENRIFAYQLAKNTKKSSFFTLSDGDGIEGICQKLGFWQISSMPSPSDSLVGAVFQVNQDGCESLLWCSAQEDRNPHGDQVNCGETCADLQMVHHLQWTPSLVECRIKYKGMVHKLILKHLFQHRSLARAVHELLAPSFCCERHKHPENSVRRTDARKWNTTPLPNEVSLKWRNRMTPKVYLLPLLHKRLGKRLDRFQIICLLVTALSTAKGLLSLPGISKRAKPLPSNWSLAKTGRHKNSGWRRPALIPC